MKWYKINETFYSIQGEGHHTGMPAVFIRFAGCNLACSFCDTDHSTYKELTQLDVMNEVKKYPCKNIVLTGGEPTLQLDPEFCYPLKEAGYQLHLETNGTIGIPTLIPFIDWLTVSPKAEGFRIRCGNEIKVVYTGQELHPYQIDTNFHHYYLQPCSGENISETLKAVLDRGNLWKLSVQLHKILEVK